MNRIVEYNELSKDLLLANKVSNSFVAPVKKTKHNKVFKWRQRVDRSSRLFRTKKTTAAK